jgi:hypothetical protein
MGRLSQLGRPGLSVRENCMKIHETGRMAEVRSGKFSDAPPRRGASPFEVAAIKAAALPFESSGGEHRLDREEPARRSIPRPSLAFPDRVQSSWRQQRAEEI